MSPELFALIIDCLVLLLLGITIVYAYRLSKSLQEFKNHRLEFDSVIANLISSIDQAERSIKSLKQVSAEEASELERLIDQSKLLSDELKIVNQASESMAGRLEELAEKNAKVVRKSQPQENMVKPKRTKEKRSAENDGYADTLKKIPQNNVDEADMPSFMRQKTEESAVQSQAEKELLEALRNNQRKISGGAE